MKFEIKNMTCGGCARNVTNAVQAVDPAAHITTDLARRSVEIQTDRSASAIAAALARAGYPVVEAVEGA
jgi:copper chaperone